jgi:hypothetical protein
MSGKLNRRLVLTEADLRPSSISRPMASGRDGSASPMCLPIQASNALS